MARSALVVGLWTLSVWFAASTAGASDPPPPVDLGNLPTTLKDFRARAGAANRPLTIAYLGLSPDADSTDPRSFKPVHRVDRRTTTADRNDTKLANYFASVASDWTKLTVVTSAGPSDSEAWTDEEFREDVRALLKHKPQVLVVREKVFRMLAASGRSESRIQAEVVLAECWRQACLPVVATKDVVRPALRLSGAMHVYIVGDRAIDASEALSHPTVAESAAPIGVPEKLLKARQADQLSSEHSLLAYVGLSTAGIPAHGPLAHLDRASRLWHCSPLRTLGPGEWSVGQQPAACRVFSVQAAFDPKARDSMLTLTGDQVGFADRVADVKNLFNEDRGSPERKLILRVHPNSKLVHLDVTARLTHLTPSLLSRSGSAVYRLDEDRDIRSLKAVTALLSAHTSEKESGAMIVAVSPNLLLKKD